MSTGGVIVVASILAIVLFSAYSSLRQWAWAVVSAPDSSVG